jgi:hypothetical protein
MPQAFSQESGPVFWASKGRVKTSASPTKAVTFDFVILIFYSS